MAETFPYHYRAFGLNIASELPITGFETSVSLPIDIHIKYGNIPEQIDPIVNSSALFQSNDHEFLFRIDSVAGYYIKDGQNVIIDRKPAATDAEVSSFLTGTSFGALLHQRHMLPLHASTIVFENKCMVFMGLSGAGKTTLATGFLRDGALLVADDISVIDFSSKKPAVRPAFPMVKIWRDSLGYFGIDNNNLVPVRSESEKYYMPIAQFLPQEKSIDLLFVLSTHNEPQVEIKPLKGLQKFQVIKRHTYLFRGIPKTGIEVGHFHQAGELIKKLPVYMLTRANLGFQTNELIKAIKDLLNSQRMIISNQTS